MTARGPWPWLVAFLVVLAGLGLVAARARRPAPRRSVAFCSVMFLLYAAGALLGWPPAATTPLVCVAPLATLLIFRRQMGGEAAPWLRLGHRPGSTVAVLAVATVLFAGLALAAWAVITRPDPGPFLAHIAGLPLWLALLGVVAFALVNPIWEEALFRGVLLEDLREAWGPTAAVIGQAVVFGAAHWVGFPSGWIGMTMAGAWGAALGVIRLRTSGIALPYLVHVTANVTIGLLAVLLLT